ncbi:MAG: hypothetical protein ACKODX_13340, partial [Gemmata sp.]
MGSSALDRVYADFVKAPTARTGVLVCSVGAAVAYPLFLLLLYLFVDLLVWRGEVPSYSQLTPAQKREFATEWAGRADADRAEAVGRLGCSAYRGKRLEARTDEELKPLARTKNEEHLFADEWETRWHAGVYLALRDRVGQAAADVYLPAAGGERAEAAEPPDPNSRPQYGLLSLVVRERNRWTGASLGKLAASNIWTWVPGASGSANVPYLTGLFVLAFGLAAVRGVLVNALAYLSAAATLDA